MAVCIVQTMSNVTQQQYDAVSHRLGMDSPGAQPPQGALAHIAGPVDGGWWCVVSEWESRQDFERFLNERLLPAVRAEGMDTEGFAPVKFEVYRSMGVGHAEGSAR